MLLIVPRVFWFQMCMITTDLKLHLNKYSNLNRKRSIRGIYLHTKAFVDVSLIKRQQNPSLKLHRWIRSNLKLHLLSVKCPVLALMSVQWSKRTLLQSLPCHILTGLCAPQTHWISHWIRQTSWYREILIFQQSWEGRKETVPREERKGGGRYVRRAAHTGGRTKRLSGKMWGSGHWNFISVIRLSF